MTDRFVPCPGCAKPVFVKNVAPDDVIRAQFFCSAECWDKNLPPTRLQPRPVTVMGEERTMYSVVLGMDLGEISNVAYYGDDLYLAKRFHHMTAEEGLPVRIFQVTTKRDEKGYWNEVERVELAVGT